MHQRMLEGEVHPLTRCLSRNGSEFVLKQILAMNFEIKETTAAESQSDPNGSGSQSISRDGANHFVRIHGY